MLVVVVGVFDVGEAVFLFFLFFYARSFTRGITVGGGLTCSTLGAPGLSLRFSVKQG